MHIRMIIHISTIYLLWGSQRKRAGGAQAFQMGAKKICLVTEVASAGISLHSDRRCLRKVYIICSHEFI